MEPLRCEMPGHVGDRRVFKTRKFLWLGRWFEGCVQCTDGIVPPAFSTTKNWREKADGKQYKISAAHVRHIKLRKLGSDGRTVYQNRRGNVT